MRFICAVLSAIAFTACALSQSFECHPVGALPTDPSLSCDGVASNNLGAGSGVSASPSCSFPVSGSQYAVLFANGPVAVPAGGPLARPAASLSTELRISIPAGSNLISLSWEFFNAEGGPQATYNDGMSIDVVSAAGAVVANLAYADTHSALSASSCGPAGEIAPAGAQALLAALPFLAPCDYISIVVWNGGDNAVASRAFVDNVQFDSALPGCAVPCFGSVGAPALACSSPLVAGSLLVSMSGMPPGGIFFLAATVNAGAYPAGWFYGIDISLQDLGNEINAGAPFVGPVSASGCSAGTASIGPIFGAPSGLTLYLVALGVPAGNLSGTPSAVTNAVGYTIP